MTAIAAIEKDGVVYMAGDSASASDYFIEDIISPKVFIRGEFIIGYTTSFRMGQLIEHSLKFPKIKRKKKIDDMDFLVNNFIPALKTCLKENGFEKSVIGEESGGTFLLGFRGKLYRVQSDYSLVRSANSYNACGSGTELALGSLFTTDNINMSPKERLEIALRAAAKFSSGVCAPFHILTLGKPCQKLTTIRTNHT